MVTALIDRLSCATIHLFLLSLLIMHLIFNYEFKITYGKKMINREFSSEVLFEGTVCLTARVPRSRLTLLFFYLDISIM